MKIGVFSNAWAADIGGGVAYIAAFAHVLREFGAVDLHFRGRITAQEIANLYGIDVQGTTICSVATQAPWGARYFPSAKYLVSDRKYDIVVRQTMSVPGPTLCPRAVLVTEFPAQRQITWRERQYLRTYRAIVANSQFTADWIRHRWRRDALVAHPVVRQIRPLAKTSSIVALGRFTGANRSKHQVELVAAFKQLLDRGVTGWELHLCGVGADPRYVERVRAQAQGLPVFLHLDVPRAELDAIVGAATIFWHATGVDFAEHADPGLMEHFGISTAEAMSAGCVPVVIGKGGQREVVGPDLLAWTWQDWSECVAKTWQLIEQPALCAALAGVATRQGAAFAFPCFADRLRQIMAPLLPETKRTGGSA